MPVPRRFDRRPPERDTTRINERIRVPEVRLIDENGNQVGVMRTDEAVRYAQSKDLDLVEVAAEAKPPVCRVLDYSKYKYEQAQKVKAAKKHQQQIVIREIKFRPKIAEHDYATKKGHVERFLRHKDKVKVTIMFRGREVTHPERGVMILDRLAEELEELCQIEQRPIQDGRNMTMVLGPSKAVLADALEAPEDDGSELPPDDSDLDETLDDDGEVLEAEAAPEPAPKKERAKPVTRVKGEVRGPEGEFTALGSLPAPPKAKKPKAAPKPKAEAEPKPDEPGPEPGPEAAPGE